MTGDVDLAQSFGRVADDYDRWRPGYPAEVVAWVGERTAGRRAAEIGAGTGKATVEFLGAGFTVTAVEPDPTMAEVGKARAPAAAWVDASAQSWDPDGEVFDLVYGAQSWHWVPERVDAALAEVLADGGAMAWIWNHPELGPEESLFGDLYARFMPEHDNSRRAGLHRRDNDGWVERLGRVTEDVEMFDHAWSRPMTAADYVALIGTYSDHITLDPVERVALQEAIHDRMMSGGGWIDLRYLTVAYLGRR